MPEETFVDKVRRFALNKEIGFALLVQKVTESS